MRNVRILLALILAVAIGLLAPGARSIVVAPTAIYIKASDPTASLTLFNPSGAPEEVTIDAVFGYPATDAEGTLRLVIDEDSEDPASAAGWIRAFPARVVVPAGGRQVVRLLVEPPAGVPDGEYWARLVVTSRAAVAPGGDAGPEEAGVRIGLDLEVRTLVPLTFRKGPVETGLRLDELAPEITGDTLRLRPRLVREGNAAWIGLLTLELIDGEGAVLERWTEQVAAYREYERALAYPVSGLPPGDYRLRVRLATEDRTDVPADHRLPSAPLERTVVVARP